MTQNSEKPSMTKSSRWGRFKKEHPKITEFSTFFVISNGVTILQMAVMPMIKYLFGLTSLVNTSFQVLPIGHNVDQSIYYVFNYAAGAISKGGGGGLAYFLAVEITLGFAQVLNFLLQRKVTFKAEGSMKKAVFWYFIAWVLISIGAAALQGLYKGPIYQFFIDTMGAGFGTTVADVLTMTINSVISFWVFYPIMKIIFKKK